MRAIYVSVHVALVLGALSHGDLGTAPIKVLRYYYDWSPPPVIREHAGVEYSVV